MTKPFVLRLIIIFALLCSSVLISQQLSVQAAGTNYVWIEAESGSITAPMQVGSDSTASSGQYIAVAPGNNSTSAPPSDGRATYSFDVSTSATYRIWARLITPSNTADSFWVRVDGGTWYEYNVIPQSSTWHWDDVHDENNQRTVILWNLSAGNHTLDVAYREDGAQLDKLLITDDAGYQPTGTGGDTEPQPTATQAPESGVLLFDDFEDGNSDGWTTAGGSWSITSDGSQVYQQGSDGTKDARSLAGSTSWTDQAVEARVKPLSFNGSSRFVAVLARVQSSDSYYYLTLRSSNVLELKKLVSGSSTMLASKSYSVATGSWYTLRLEVVGTTLTGYVNGVQELSASDAQFASGRIGLATFYASAAFDDVRVTQPDAPSAPTATATPTTAPSTPTPTTSPSTPTPTPDSPPPPSDGPIGFASVNALGQNGTTGGAGGPTVTVSNASQFLDYANRSTPYIIQVDGTITLSGMNRITSDKTIIGLGSNATISGGGLNMSGVKNIIIRNLTFTNADDDSINIQESAHHIWIDHCTFTNGYDGLLDIKRGSDFITVSWNHFHSHGKTMLLGHSDSNASQDVGHLRVTYHHNFFDGTQTRHPRVRFGEPVHVFNNYYRNNQYGVASTMDAGVMVEGNYFENVPDPILDQYGSSDPGRVVERNNIFVGSGAPQTHGSVVEPSTYYQYTLDDPADVPALVTSGAGVGKIN